ncbi:MFS transporter [Paenibacillus sp. FJAT-26967]|uniref:MDR family MFS transporter n=1 Tax=Paenibacillus sp. FJAT-26967 TaxID=1729690 RepID=UPI000838B25B|nr:MFS transporter [Paenibacillus sp. FJAT-26967]
MNRIRHFLSSYHPIVHTLLFGTVMARAASSMSMPFLALYLVDTTSMSKGMIGLVIGASSLAGTVGGFIGGTLSDRIGRKAVMQGALFTWGAVFIGFSLVSHPFLFLLLNLISGLCRSFYEPVSQALMADLTEKDKRLRVYSLRYLAINIGVAVGPLMGAYFGMIKGSLPFLITGFVYLAYAVFLWTMMNKFRIKHVAAEVKERITFSAAWHVVRKDMTLRYQLLGGMIGAIGYSQMAITLSQYINESFADGVKLFAAMMSVNALTVIVLQLPLARLTENRSPLLSIVLGNVLFALGDVGFALSDHWMLLLASMVVFTVGETLNFPAATMLMDRIAPEHMRGTYFGAQTLTSLGHFIGPWVGGILLASMGGSMFLVMAVVTMSSSLLYWRGSLLLARRTESDLSRNQAL